MHLNNSIKHNMKNLFLTIAIITAASIFSYSQNLLTFRIDTMAYVSSGDSISTGAVVSFTAHVGNVSTTGKIAYDIAWWQDTIARDENFDKIFICTSDSTDRVATRLLSYYQPVSDPTAVSYTNMLAALKTWLEGIFGTGNVTTI